MKIGSLFSGYGGLTMGIQSVLGGDLAWNCDYDAGPSKVLAHHHPDVPNLRDVTTVDWATVEPVDVIEGGSPCQDVSAAGKRAGMRAGTRSGLWASMCDAIDIIRPSLVVWENVRGVTSACADSELGQCPGCLGLGLHRPVLRALGRVLGDLADLGYDASWHGLRAAEVGAPHPRFRVFVVAWPAAHANGVGVDGSGLHGSGEWRRPEPAHRGLAAADADDLRRQAEGPSGRAQEVPAAAVHGDAATDAEGDGWDEGWAEPEGLVGRLDAAFSGDAAAHPGDDGREGRPELHQRPELGQPSPLGLDAHGRAGATWGPYGPAIARWERVIGRAAPAPTEVGDRGGRRLAAPFVEWLMGLPIGHVTAVPGVTRTEQLKLLGNGVVPQQAARALDLMLADVPVGVLQRLRATSPAA